MHSCDSLSVLDLVQTKGERESSGEFLDGHELLRASVDVRSLLGLKLAEQLGEGHGQGFGRLDLVDFTRLAQCSFDDVSIIVVELYGVNSRINIMDTVFENGLQGIKKELNPKPKPKNLSSLIVFCQPKLT